MLVTGLVSLVAATVLRDVQPHKELPCSSSQPNSPTSKERFSQSKDKEDQLQNRLKTSNGRCFSKEII